MKQRHLSIVLYAKVLLTQLATHRMKQGNRSSSICTTVWHWFGPAVSWHLRAPSQAVLVAPSASWEAWVLRTSSDLCHFSEVGEVSVPMHSEHACSFYQTKYLFLWDQCEKICLGHQVWGPGDTPWVIMGEERGRFSLLRMLFFKPFRLKQYKGIYTNKGMLCWGFIGERWGGG